MDDLYRRLSKSLFDRRLPMIEAQRAYDGDGPLPKVDPEERDILGDRVQPLVLMLCRLVIDTMMGLLLVTGFRSSPGEAVDRAIMRWWQRLSLDELAQLVQFDSLLYGSGYFSVWVDDLGQPLVAAESALNTAVMREAATGRTVAGMRRWMDEDGYLRAWVATADEITNLASSGRQPTESWLTSDFVTSTTGEGMKVVSREPNVLGMVPLIPLVNRPRTGRLDGESELHSIIGLQRAVSQVVTQMLVATDTSATTRKWVTGLAPHFTSSGRGMSEEQRREMTDSIKNGWERARASKWIATDSDSVRFGQFEPASLEGFETVVRLLVGQAAALSGLPPHFVDNAAVNPVSAEALRVSSYRLAQRAKQIQRWWSGTYEDLMRTVVTIANGSPDPRLDDLETVWAEPAPRSMAQEADAASKLVGSSILDRRAALESLGATPLEIDRQTANIPTSEVL